MTNEQKFMSYLSALKGTQNQKLIECVEEGFKTLVEYQVVGDMTQRSTDIMEGTAPAGVPDEVVQLIEKLTEEIEELRGAMQSIDDIADEYDNEEYDSPEEFETDSPSNTDEKTDSDSESPEDEREPVEEGVSEEKSASEVESGGTVDERDPSQVPDVDPRDVDPIEMGQRLGKVEGSDCRDGIEECGCGKAPIEEGMLSSEVLPDNVQQGEAAGNDVEDSEGAMANKQLNQIADQSERLAGSFDDKEELKAWVQAKITKAQETIDSLYDYFNEAKGLDDKVSTELSPEVITEE
jgi:hypothetical protein